ncbi:MAG: HAMP domain-containing histidine kinase, partial [Nitrospirae bacterium]|nr:HAMP domain-containing histidine kinase [Nitrospirota bacterium]
SVIKSACDVTLRKERTAAEYQETLQKIGETADRITETIQRILELSRMEGRTSLLKITEIDLMDLLRDVQRLLEPSAAAREIVLTLNGESVSIQGDRERLMEALTNLAENAVQYNRPAGRVEIRVDRREDQAVIAVADTGIGIPEAEREKIFERFYRRETGGQRAAGSGLGLPIAEAIVQAHGGRIEVESAPGKGSCFRIFLPIEIQRERLPGR